MKRKVISYSPKVGFYSTTEACKIGNVTVPKAPNSINYIGVLEICHSFTYNFIKERQRMLNEKMPSVDQLSSSSSLTKFKNAYFPSTNGYETVSIASYLLKALDECKYKKEKVANLLEYDIIVIYKDTTILHSMVVINKNKWVGSNNTNTFSKVFVKAGASVEALSKLAWRSVIDFSDLILKKVGLKYKLDPSGKNKLYRYIDEEELYFDVYRKKDI